MVQKIDKVTDHLGTEYDNTQEMCAVWGVNYDDYQRLRRDGCTKKEALTNESIRLGNISKQIPDAKPCTDHKGRKFDSINSMCKFYKIKTPTYYSRIDAGMSQEKALTTPVTSYMSKPKDTIYEDSCDDKFMNTYKDFTKQRAKLFELEHKCQLLDRKIEKATIARQETRKEIAEFKKKSSFSKELSYFNTKFNKGVLKETPTAKNNYSVIMSPQEEVKISVDDIIGILTPAQIKELQRKINK